MLSAAPATAIYALCHPGTQEIRYIGKTKQPKRRLAGHVCKARLGTKTHVADWIRSLNADPAMKILATVPESSASEIEIMTIAHFRARGYRLTNLTDGGDGHSGVKASFETRAKLRASHLGHHHSKESRAKIGAASMGNKYALGHRASAAARAKRSATLKALGHCPSPECHASARMAKLGKRRSPETCARISIGRLGKGVGHIVTPETRAKISASNKGKSRGIGHLVSAETRAKLRAAWVKRRAT